MALLPILCYPDPKLHKVAKPVQAVDARIKTLVSDMLHTMYEAKGIGLAATQVDVHERLIVIDVSEERDAPLVLINPQVIWQSADTHLNEEGCLSVPGIYDGVKRFDAIKVQALDGEGASRIVEATEFVSFNEIRAAGINVRYDAAADQIVLKIGRAQSELQSPC